MRQAHEILNSKTGNCGGLQRLLFLSEVGPACPNPRMHARLRSDEKQSVVRRREGPEPHIYIYLHMI